MLGSLFSVMASTKAAIILDDQVKFHIYCFYLFYYSNLRFILISVIKWSRGWLNHFLRHLEYTVQHASLLFLLKIVLSFAAVTFFSRHSLSFFCNDPLRQKQNILISIFMIIILKTKYFNWHIAWNCFILGGIIYQCLFSK